MKFDKNYTEIVSQITKELKKNHPDNTKSINTDSQIKDKEKLKMESNTEKENDFVNKSGIKYDKFINKLELKSNNNIKKYENISSIKDSFKVFENPRDIVKNNNDDTLPFTFDNHERHLTEEKHIQEKCFSFQNKNIKLKTFKKTVNISKSFDMEGKKYYVLFNINSYFNYFINIQFKYKR